MAFPGPVGSATYVTEYGGIDCSDVAGYRRTMTCRNGVWDGYGSTHPFLDDRSTVVHGPSAHITFEQEATLRVPSSAPVPSGQYMNYQTFNLVAD